MGLSDRDYMYEKPEDRIRNFKKRQKLDALRSRLMSIYRKKRLTLCDRVRIRYLDYKIKCALKQK